MKIIVFYQSVLFVFYVFLLGKRFQVEEILFLFLLPVFASLLIKSGAYLWRIVLRKPIRLRKIFKLDLLPLAVLQTLFLIVFLFLLYPQTVNSEDIRKDLDTLPALLRDIHPDLYHTTLEQQFIEKIDSLKSSLPDRVSKVRYYRQLSGLLAMIGDSPTRTGEHFFQDRIRILFYKSFPYKIKIHDDRIFVVGNYAYKKVIPAGAEIIKINGKTAKAFIDDISKLLSYENEHSRIERIANPVLIGLWNEFENFIISYRDPSGERIFTIRSAGGLFANIAILQDLSNCSPFSHYTFKQIENKIGYLRISECIDQKKLLSYLDRIFKKIKKKKVTDLIIDIRNNSGENSLLYAELMRYISEHPYTLYDSVAVKVSQVLVDDGYLHAEAVKGKIGQTITVRPPNRVRRSTPYRFTGDVYLLINGKTFSSASRFAFAFRCAEIGPVIGMKTGTALVAFGDSYRFKLPSSGFPVRCACKLFYNHCASNQTAITPNVFITNSYMDIINKRDRVLEVALDMIKKKPIVK